MDELSIMMGEYNSIRAEVLESLKSQAQVLSWGLATIGVIFAGLFATVSPDSFEAKTASTTGFLNNTSTVITVNQVDLTSVYITMFCFIIPLFSFLLLMMWLGELVRFVRCGAFLVNLERKINEKIGKTVLHWETWLTGTRVGWVYFFPVGLFVAIMIVMPFIGHSIVNKTDSVTFIEFIFSWDWWGEKFVGIALVLLSTLIAGYFLRVVARWRRRRL